MPLSFSDCEAFLLSDLLSEYALVGAEYARAPHKMDPRYPGWLGNDKSLHRGLTRLRMQPDYRVPVLFAASEARLDRTALSTNPASTAHEASMPLLFRIRINHQSMEAWTSRILPRLGSFY